MVSVSMEFSLYHFSVCILLCKVVIRVHTFLLLMSFTHNIMNEFPFSYLASRIIFFFPFWLYIYLLLCCKYFFPVCCLSFNFMNFFDVQKLQILIFSFMDFCFCVQGSHKYSHIFSFKLHFLKFKSLIYLEFYRCRV